MDRLKGKRALITGGTTGIGLETARQFRMEGARVAVTGTNPDTIASARAALGEDVLVIRADAGDVAAQQHIADEVAKAFGGLDIVFVNAGIAVLKPIEHWSEGDYDRSFAINVKGPFFLVQALLPLLGNPSSIVLNTSINARIGMPNSSVYGATKGALSTFIRTLSGELVGRGIRVNAVSPGPVVTPLHSKFGLKDEEMKATADYILSQIPVGRFGEPSEVAKAVVFLASDESAFTVGSELVIDGGMSNL